MLAALALMAVVGADPGAAMVGTVPLTRSKIDTSAELRAILTDETGSGAACFATSPTFTTSIAVNGAGSDPADSGAVRMNNSECISWESSPAGTDNCLTVSASEGLLYGGQPVIIETSIDTCAEFAALTSTETGTCGGLVLSVSPTFGTSIAVNSADPADGGAVRLNNNEAVCWEASPAGTDVCLVADSSEVVGVTGGTIGSSSIGDPTRVYSTGPIALTEAILTGTGAGQFGHADGVPLVAAPGANRRLQFIEAMIRYDRVTASYTTCTSGAVRIHDGSSWIQVSEAIASHFTAGTDLVQAYSPNDSWGTTANVATAFINGAMMVSGTACVDPGTADGTATITVYYRIVED